MIWTLLQFLRLFLTIPAAKNPKATTTDDAEGKSSTALLLSQHSHQKLRIS